jgi:ABC-2 type transport system ATP-binding protein
VIDLDNVVKTFGSTHALDGLTLHVDEGEVHGFLGPNGSGKTTSLRILLGLLKPDSGTARLFDADPWLKAEKLHRRLAYVPGEVTLWPSLTGGETIDALGRMRWGYVPKRRDDLMARFDFNPRTKVSTYSKGNRQKVALIAALSCDVDLYLFDEPTDGLDPLMAEVFRECVRELQKNGRTVLLSSHVLAEVDAVCDQVTILRSGKSVESGSLADLKKVALHTITATLDTPVTLDDLPGVHKVQIVGKTITASVDTDVVPQVLSRLVTAGTTSVEVQPPTLEELFLMYYSGKSTAS